MKQKLIIATPFYNSAGFAPYISSMHATQRVLDKLGVDWEFWELSGDSYVDRARNTICARFLESDATDLLFIDSDQSWPPEAPFILLNRPELIVGGSYPQKNNWGTYSAILKLEDGCPLGMVIGDNLALLEADLLPAGFMRIKREALEKLAPHVEKYIDPSADPQAPGRPYYNFFACHVENMRRYGEDGWFCKQWKRLGEKLWIYPDFTIGHYGINKWEGNLHQHLLSNKQE